MERTFTSLKDLRAEIDLLKVKRFHQEEVLKDKLTDPSAIFHTITSRFKPKSSTANKSFLFGLLDQDIITNLAGLFFPMMLNGTVFKKSGVVVRTLVTFLSQKAAATVNIEAILGLIDKMKSWFKHKKQQREEKKEPVDYGIPPYSETF